MKRAIVVTPGSLVKVWMLSTCNYSSAKFLFGMRPILGCAIFCFSEIIICSFGFLAEKYFYLELQDPSLKLTSCLVIYRTGSVNFASGLEVKGCECLL